MAYSNGLYLGMMPSYGFLTRGFYFFVLTLVVIGMFLLTRNGKCCCNK